MKDFSKKLFLIMLALLPCFSTTLLAGEGTSDDPEEIPLKPEYPENPPRPRARSRSRSTNITVAPECYYYNGEVSISTGDDVYYISATVTRLGDNVQWNGSAAGNELFISVPTESGTYVLELTLSNGMSYYGEYTLY